MDSSMNTDKEVIDIKQSKKSNASYNKAKAELDSVLELMTSQTRRADLGERFSDHEKEQTLRLFLSKFSAYIDEAKKLD